MARWGVLPRGEHFEQWPTPMRPSLALINFLALKNIQGLARFDEDQNQNNEQKATIMTNVSATTHPVRRSALVRAWLTNEWLCWKRSTLPLCMLCSCLKAVASEAKV